MKLAPIYHALAAHAQVEQLLIHSGQHYDPLMSRVFFNDLGLPAPDIDLEVGSGSHAEQTARVMLHLEPLVIEHNPDMVLVYGDVNSTLAAALVCAKLQTPVSHVEAGLRSFDRAMPEEVNRVVTDHLCDLLFTPSRDADQNLIREGLPHKQIHLVGNVMIDTLVRLLPKTASATSVLRQRLNVPERYGLVTLHRPSNVDEGQKLRPLLSILKELSRELPLIFPVHPRTRQTIDEIKFSSGKSLHLCEPLGYIDFLALQKSATVVITDSGGIQEETTYLNVPCITLRDNTERPITVELGTNVLVGGDLSRLRDAFTLAASGRGKKGTIPPLWDGNTATRIVQILLASEARKAPASS